MTQEAKCVPIYLRQAALSECHSCQAFSPKVNFRPHSTEEPLYIVEVFGELRVTIYTGVAGPTDFPDGIGAHSILEHERRHERVYSDNWNKFALQANRFHNREYCVRECAESMVYMLGLETQIRLFEAQVDNAEIDHIAYSGGGYGEPKLLDDFKALLRSEVLRYEKMKCGQQFK